MAIKGTPRVHWLVLAACLLPCHSARASWSGFVSMGPTITIGDPSCTLLAAGKVICAARGLQQTMLVNQFSGSTWNGWKSIAGVITSNTSCTDDGSGNVFCGARSTTSALVVAKFNGTAWSALTTVGGQLTSAPSCTSFAAGKVVCVARSVTGGLTATVFNGASWGAFSSLAASTTSAPSCASDSAGHAVCAVLTIGANVLATRFNGSSWSAFLNLRGEATSELSCMDLQKSGEVSCFVRGPNTGLWINTFKGGSWSTTSWTGWGSLGGQISKPSCAPVSSDNLVCGIIGNDQADSALWVIQFNGTAWGPWTKLAKSGIGAPSCATLGTGKVLCSIVQVNNGATSVTGP
jgi:hypothetical protein